MIHIKRINEMINSFRNYNILCMQKDKGGKSFYNYKIVPSNYEINTDSLSAGKHEYFFIKNLSKQEANDCLVFLKAREFMDNCPKNIKELVVSGGNAYDNRKDIIRNKLFVLYLLVAINEGPTKVASTLKDVTSSIKVGYKAIDGFKEREYNDSVKFTDLYLKINRYYGDKVYELDTYSFDLGKYKQYNPF